MPILLQIGVILGFAVIIVAAWAKANQKGWQRFAFLCTLLMYPFAVSLGEKWYHLHGTLPYLFGIEKYYLDSTDYSPVFLMIGSVIVITILCKPLVGWIAARYSSIERLPGRIQPHYIGLVFLLLALYVAGSAGAYMNRRNGSALGTSLVHYISLGTGEMMATAADINNDLSKSTSPESVKGKPNRSADQQTAPEKP
ncbi:MAG: hypothetical protein WCV50_06600 [Patescibacteria group bacterium]